MADHPLKILVVFDLPEPCSQDEAWKLVSKHPDWQDERDVISSLRRLGYQVGICALHDNLQDLISTIKEEKPDVVFPLCECFANDRSKGAQIVSVLELLGVPYTGATSRELMLFADKGLSKSILKAHGHHVPEFVVVEGTTKKERDKLRTVIYPAIVKPLSGEGSEGVSGSSYVSDSSDCWTKVKQMYKKSTAPLIVEQFIEGREIYLSLLPFGKVRVLHPREFVIKHRSTNEPLIATYRAKWDDAYRKKRGIHSKSMRTISKTLKSKLDDLGLSVLSRLNIKGYLRLDLRVDALENVYFIEANPNPAINRLDEFASSAKASGLNYDQLISQIVEQAISVKAAS